MANGLIDPTRVMKPHKTQKGGIWRAPGLVKMWFGVSGMLQEVLEAQQTFPILYPIHHFHLTVPELCWCCSVAPPCPTLCNPMDCSTPGFPVLHYFLEFAQTHVHWVSDAIQPSHPLSPPSLPALNLSQHQGLFQWITSGGQCIGASASASVL